MEIYHETEETKYTQDVKGDQSRYVKTFHREKYTERLVTNPYCEVQDGSQLLRVSATPETPESQIRKNHSSWDKTWELRYEPGYQRRSTEFEVPRKGSVNSVATMKWDVPYDNKNFIRSQMSDVRGIYRTSRPQDKWEIPCHDNRNYVKSFLSESVLMDKSSTAWSSQEFEPSGASLPPSPPVKFDPGHTAQTSIESFNEYLASLRKEDSPVDGTSTERREENSGLVSSAEPDPGHGRKDSVSPTSPVKFDPGHVAQTSTESIEEYLEHLRQKPKSETTDVLGRSNVTPMADLSPMAPTFTRFEITTDYPAGSKISEIEPINRAKVTDTVEEDLGSQQNQLLKSDVEVVEHTPKTSVVESQTSGRSSGVFRSGMPYPADDTVAVGSHGSESRMEVREFPILAKKSGYYYLQTTPYENAISDVVSDVSRHLSSTASEYREMNGNFPVSLSSRTYEIPVTTGYPAFPSSNREDPNSVRICETCCKKCHCKRDTYEQPVTPEGSLSAFGNTSTAEYFSTGTLSVYPDEERTLPKYRSQAQIRQQCPTCCPHPHWQAAYGYGAISRNDLEKENIHYIVCKCERKSTHPRSFRNRLTLTMTPLQKHENQIDKIEVSFPTATYSIDEKEKSNNINAGKIYLTPYSEIRVQSDCSICSEDGASADNRDDLSDQERISYARASNTNRLGSTGNVRESYAETGSGKSVYWRPDSPISSDDEFHSAQDITFDSLSAGSGVANESASGERGRAPHRSSTPMQQTAGHEFSWVKNHSEHNVKTGISAQETDAIEQRVPSGGPYLFADDAIKVEDVPSQEHLDYKTYVSKWPISN